MDEAFTATQSLVGEYRVRSITASEHCYPRRLAFSPDDTSLLIATQDGIKAAFSLLDLNSGECIPCCPPVPTREVRALNWGPLDHALCAGTHGYKTDDTVYVWNALTGHLLQELRISGEVCSGIAMSLDASKLACGYQSEVVGIWDLSVGTQIQTLQSEVSPDALAFSADGDLLAIGGTSLAEPHDKDYVTLWSLVSDDPPLRSRAGRNNVWATAFSPDGSLLAVARRTPGSCGQVQVHELPDLKSRFTANRLSFPTFHLQFTPDSSRLVLAVGRAIDLWDTVTQQQIGEYWVEGWPSMIQAMTLSRSGTRVATGHTDSAIRLWSI